MLHSSMAHSAGSDDSPVLTASAECPLEPPKVYRGADDEHWIVEPAPHASERDGLKVFLGCQRALNYAYETYGNARFFPF